MMNAPRHIYALLALGTCLGLSACTDDNPPAKPAAALKGEHAYVAIARGKIEAQGGLVTIQPAQDGHIVRLPVSEGQQVAAGAVLAELDSRNAQIELNEAEARLQQAQAQAQAASLPLAAARDLAQRLRQAAEAGASDVQRADEAQQRAQQLQAAASVAGSELAIARERLEAAKQHLAVRTLRAPQAGTVIQLDATIGTQVLAQGGKPLMTILPAKPPQIRAELNESFVAQVKPGMRADISIEADPQRKPLAARVLRVGQVFVNSRLGDDGNPRSNLRVVDCVLTFDEVQDVRIGQNVRVSFHE
ncbi:HlyD family secretion protein [Herminiimonas glaciei]|uniref:HlyD family secretion protein n=1 Tax=Herminiimonas glaciei TaxID=523788 RepID=A0ABW2IA07_9BURK